MWIKLCNLSFPRDNAPENERWWNVGEIFHDITSKKTVVKLTAFRVGFIKGDVFPDIIDPPFLQGTLEVTLERNDGVPMVIQPVGRIYSNEDSDGRRVHYAIQIECIPVLTSKDKRGIHLRIRSDDGT